MGLGIANTTVSLWDMFYLGNPHRHMYKDIKHVPHIYAQVNWIYDETLLTRNGIKNNLLSQINWKFVVISDQHGYNRYMNIILFSVYA